MGDPEVLNGYADQPDLAIILTAEPEVCVARVSARGSHGWFEAGLLATGREVERFLDIAERLRDAAGWAFSDIDSTAASADDLAVRNGPPPTAGRWSAASATATPPARSGAGR